MSTIAYRILAYIGLAAVLFGLGYYYGNRHAVASIQAKYAAELAASVEQSHAQEQKWQADFNLNARNLTNVLNSTISDRDRIIRRLHNDQNRASVSSSSGTSCKGTDWRTLPAEMGEDIIREVAERDQYREGLIACYSAIDSLR